MPQIPALKTVDSTVSSPLLPIIIYSIAQIPRFGKEPAEKTLFFRPLSDIPKGVMKMGNGLVKRKRLRLTAYDYSNPGAYFVTICTQNRKPMLSSIDKHVGVGALDDPYKRDAAAYDFYVQTVL